MLAQTQIVTPSIKKKSINKILPTNSQKEPGSVIWLNGLSESNLTSQLARCFILQRKNGPSGGLRRPVSLFASRNWQSAQCGFAGVAEGNIITCDDEVAKLLLAVETVGKISGGRIIWRQGVKPCHRWKHD